MRACIPTYNVHIVCYAHGQGQQAVGRYFEENVRAPEAIANAVIGSQIIDFFEFLYPVRSRDFRCWRGRAKSLAKSRSRNTRLFVEFRSVRDNLRFRKSRV